MKVISKEEFKNADIKVQDKIMKWWNPTLGDVIDVDGTIDLVVRCVEGKLFDCAWNNFKLGYHDVTPLLSEGQLIEFIENQLGEDVDIYRAGMKGHQISTEWIDGVGKSKFEFRTDTHDLLLALWECVKEVCK